jgi:hypothetical protein
MFGAALARHAGLPGDLPFPRWDDALDYLFGLDAAVAGPIVIDEFPYLVKASPQLPSLLKRELDARGPSQPGGRPVRLLLCGSARSVMGSLLAGSAPLRGRAGREMVVRPFGYREAAEFWGAADPRLAVLLHAVVGGTPAYRRQFVRDDAPDGPADFDAWVVRAVLNPDRLLLREARYLLAGETDVRDPAIYHSVLAAVATGDCFRSGRTRYRIAEPLIAFYEAIMRPRWSDLEQGLGESVWADSRTRFLSGLAGPQFGQLCRDFARQHGREAFGQPVGEVGHGTVADPVNRSEIEIDVAVLGPAAPGARRQVVSLGEAKGFDTSETILACYAGNDCDAALREEAARHRILLVGPQQLYGRPAR